MTASTTATTMTTRASSATLRPGARMLHGDSASPGLLANARNSAVLRETSGPGVSWLPAEFSVLAENPLLAGQPGSRSDMAKTPADLRGANVPGRAEPRQTGPQPVS